MPSSPPESRVRVRAVDDLITEYLTYQSYDQTLENFLESTSATSPNARVRDLDGDDGDNVELILTEFMTAFDEGNHVDLFILWQNHVPRPLLRVNSQHPDAITAMKLEFYLNLHCAVYPFRDEILAEAGSLEEASKRCGKAMSVFRRYISSRGKSLSQTPEFIAFYALPYVPSPTEHPTFKGMFKEEWMLELRRKLRKFIAGNLEGGGERKLPAIFSAVEKSQRVDKMGSELREVGSKLSNVVSFAESVYNVSLELWDSLKRRDGETDFVMEVGEQLRGFQDTFAVLKGAGGSYSGMGKGGMGGGGREMDMGMDMDMGGAGRAGGEGMIEDYGVYDASAFLAEPKAPSPQSSPRVPRPLAGSMGTLASLDMVLVKKDLLELSKKDDSGVACALLLQALRWRFERGLSFQTRQAVLQGYIRNDVLGAGSFEGGISEGDLFQSLLQNASPLISEYAARFVNSMATHGRARRYLLGPGCIKCLCDVLLGCEGDSILRQQVLGSLQKCSLKRQAQDDMIRGGLVRWALGVLRGHLKDPLADYSLEYVTALLMNLCLRSEGKKKVEECLEGEEKNSLSVLMSLMESHNMQVRQYANGAVYGLLQRVGIRERAVEMRADDKLRDISKRSKPNFRRQIAFILGLLISSAPEGQSDNEEDEGDDVDESSVTPDVVREDDQVEEGVVEGREQGEGLLCGRYLIQDLREARKESGNDEAKIVGMGGVPYDDLPVGGRGGMGGDGVVLMRAVTPQLMKGRGGGGGIPVGEAEMEAMAELKQLQEARDREKEEGRRKGRRRKDEGRAEMKDEEAEAFGDRGHLVRSPVKGRDGEGGDDDYDDEEDWD